MSGNGGRRAVILAALGGTVVLAAACGGGGPPAAASKAYQKALAFSHCMRSHGALAFPDPTSEGTFNVSQIDVNSPLIASAAGACRGLLPPGAVPVPPAQQRLLVSRALNYAACMRSHGWPSFPDPQVQQGSISFTLPSNGIPADSPQFKSADHLCRELTGGGP